MPSSMPGITSTDGCHGPRVHAWCEFDGVHSDWRLTHLELNNCVGLHTRSVTVVRDVHLHGNAVRITEKFPLEPVTVCRLIQIQVVTTADNAKTITSIRQQLTGSVSVSEVPSEGKRPHSPANIPYWRKGRRRSSRVRHKINSFRMLRDRPRFLFRNWLKYT